MPGVPQPVSSITPPVVLNNNYDQNIERQETPNSVNVEKDGFALIEPKKRKQKRTKI